MELQAIDIYQEINKLQAFRSGTAQKSCSSCFTVWSRAIVKVKVKLSLCSEARIASLPSMW